MEEKLWDVVIVGGGPAGLTAYLYAKRSLLKTLLIEKGPIGGQVLLTDLVENYPGFPEGIAGFELIQKMQEQVEKYGLDLLQEKAVELKAEGKIKEIILESGSSVKTKTVILALGAGMRKLGIPGEKELTGKGVSYCATCDGPFFRDQVVAVIGGGNTALQEALYLTKFAKKVYLIHRRDAFRATPILQQRVKENPKIEIVWNTVLKEIKGKEAVEGVITLNKKTGEEGFLEVSGVFIFIGHEPETEWLRGVIELDEKGFILVNQNMETSLPGVYACGDCISKPFRQIVNACGEGAVAALSAEKYLENSH
jgi:thioredoxin reductase (NADPH)